MQNVVVYGLTMKSYRIVVYKIFSGCKKKAVQVMQGKASEEPGDNPDLKLNAYVNNAMDTKDEASCRPVETDKVNSTAL